MLWLGTHYLDIYMLTLPSASPVAVGTIAAPKQSNSHINIAININDCTRLSGIENIKDRTPNAAQNLIAASALFPLYPP